MKPRTLLILLVLVLGLGAFVWFFERKLPSSEERKALSKKVLELDKADVTAVAIDSPKGKIRLERTAGKEPAAAAQAGTPPQSPPAVEWRLTQPLATRADSFAVDRLLDAIAALEKTRTLDDVDPKAVGLDKPRVVVRLATKKGERVLELGAEVPPGGSLIAGVEGRKGAYVVGDGILSEVDKNPGDWRDHLIFRGDREAVRRITLTGGAGGPVVLAKRADGFWIESPFVDRADHDLVDGLLSDLTGLTADRFLDGSRSPSALGLEPPRGSVAVELAGSPPVRIDLGTAVTGAATPEGQPSGEVAYARAGDASFEVRTRLGESARRAPADWRALQLSAFEVHQVESAKITSTVNNGSSAMALTRAGTDWKRGGTLISYLPVSDLLFAVTGGRAERVLTPAEAQASQAGTAKPLLAFELRTKDAGSETLTLYPPIKEGVPARASGRDVVLLLPADTLNQIQTKLKAVQEAKAAKP